ncbi:unnamed protein product [Orchesella dallaii]|uniref:Uncharacterized protein n=1 Tax=Orchesella dallaii TaxID=48710 RepID=A0ABP1S3T4_9HEXA
MKSGIQFGIVFACLVAMLGFISTVQGDCWPNELGHPATHCVGTQKQHLCHYICRNDKHDGGYCHHSKCYCHGNCNSVAP